MLITAHDLTTLTQQDRAQLRARLGLTEFCTSLRTEMEKPHFGGLEASKINEPYLTIPNDEISRAEAIANEGAA